jgi:hypothetical protein
VVIGSGPDKDDLATVNDEFISFKEETSHLIDIADVEIKDLKRGLRMVRDMRMTTAERLINLSGIVTELLGSVGLLLIDVEPLQHLPQAMEQLTLLGQITNLHLEWAEDRVGALEQRVAELSVAVHHRANNPIVLDVEEEVRAGSPMPLMIRIEQEGTRIPPS